MRPKQERGSNVVLLVLFIGIVAIQLSHASERSTTSRTIKAKGETSNIHGRERPEGRSIDSLLRNWDPIRVWRSTSQIVQKGIRVFRESLHEGAKVAAMLKEDVDEGVTHIWGQKEQQHEANDEHKDQPETHLSGPSSDKVAAESAYEQQSTRADQNYNSPSARGVMFGSIFRLMNIDSNRLGMIAINILIFLAEKITASLIGRDANSIPEARALKQGVMEWVVNGESPILHRFVKDAKSDMLPESLIETLRQRSGNSTACVQLLVCKMSPLIWGVQQTIEKSLDAPDDTKEAHETPRSFWATSSHILNDLMTSFPTKDGFVKFGDNCERRFPNCRLLKFKNNT